MPVPSAVTAAIVNTVINAVSGAPSAQPQAQVEAALARSFPADARKGELVTPVLTQVQISGQSLAAAPGLQIRNEKNLIVMPGTLQGALPVRYQLDPGGSVWRIWILSAAEQAAP